MKTRKFEKVLIALDYDPSANKVAESGYSLAKAINAEVVLLHIVVDPVFYTSTDFSPITGFGDYMGMLPLQTENADGMRNAAQHFLDKVKNHLGDENIVTCIEEGEIAETIAASAKLKHADVIVIGSHSRKWLEDIVMGSVTQEVLRHAVLPVFIIPVRKPA